MKSSQFVYLHADQFDTPRLATDARGVTVTYTYDALNRLLSASYPDSSLDVSYSYDQGAGQKGRLTGITDGSGTTALVYDPFGNLVQDSRTIDGQVLQTSYSYDGADQLASVTYPSGRTVSYGRDAVGRTTSVTTEFGGQNQTVLSSAQHLPFGPLAGFTFGNGLAVERSHDQQYRLDEVTAQGVEDRTYAYDPAGNIDAITDNLNNSFSRAFAQDALDRLTSDQGGFGTRTYQYDPVGNRTGRWLDGAPEQTITVVSNSNRLATIDTAAVSYDAAGNVLADGTGRTFGYNDLNRLSTASVSGQTVATFAYNAFGQRVRKTDIASNTSKVFAYGPGGQILAERRLRSDGTRELEREYLWLDSVPIAMAERSYAADGTTVTASQFVHLHADHLDTPRLATDAAQRVVWRWRSDAFGIGVAETDPDGDSIATNVPLRFPGQYHDAETGLQYNYKRDYDPQVGRYVQSDPIGLRGGVNTYSYVKNNPVALVDPLGLCSCPGGEWKQEFGDSTVYFAVGGYGSMGRVNYVCRSKPSVKCSATQVCIGGGPIIGGGINWNLYGRQYGVSNSGGFGGWGGWNVVGSIGPISGSANVPGPGGNVGIGASLGAGLGAVRCVNLWLQCTCDCEQ